MAGINGIDQAENVTNEKFGKENGIESSKKQGISFPAVFSHCTYRSVYSGLLE